MADYLMQISYTPEAWAVMIKRPHNRVEALTKVVEGLGGKIQGFWMCFGEHDFVGVVEMPDNVSAAGFAIAIGGGGACKSVKTTPLLKIEEGIDAMKKAGGSGYKPAKGVK
jgi:uncharacterized protein with GYD domain